MTANNALIAVSSTRDVKWLVYVCVLVVFFVFFHDTYLHMRGKVCNGVWQGVQWCVAWCALVCGKMCNGVW